MFNLSYKLLKNPWLTIIATMLITLVFSFGLRDLHSNYDMRYWLNKEDPLIKELNFFERYFGSDETIVIAIENEKGVFNSKSIKLTHELSEKISDLEDINQVFSLLTFKKPVKKSNKIEFEKIVDFDKSNDKYFFNNERKLQ